jgi:hypothetical protein
MVEKPVLIQPAAATSTGDHLLSRVHALTAPACEPVSRLESDLRRERPRRPPLQRPSAPCLRARGTPQCRLWSSTTSTRLQGKRLGLSLARGSSAPCSWRSRPRPRAAGSRGGPSRSASGSRPGARSRPEPATRSKGTPARAARIGGEPSGLGGRLRFQQGG